MLMTGEGGIGLLRDTFESLFGTLYGLAGALLISEVRGVPALVSRLYFSTKTGRSRLTTSQQECPKRGHRSRQQ